jgi:hypothetical protein
MAYLSQICPASHRIRMREIALSCPLPITAIRCIGLSFKDIHIVSRFAAVYLIIVFVYLFIDMFIQALRAAVQRMRCL